LRVAILDHSTMMTNRSSELVITNAVIVLADQMIDHGWVAVSGGRIAEIGAGSAPEPGIDFGGDLLLPGLVELHTDHLETHYLPRPEVHWDPLAAVVSYDAQIATSGITTVLDSVRVWRDEEIHEGSGQSDILSAAIASARDAGLLRAEHFLHLRCEVPMPWVVEDTEKLAQRCDVRLLSLMDHTPGQRQFRDPERLRSYYRGRNAGLSGAELEQLFEVRIAHQLAYAEHNRRQLIEMAQRRGIPIASHDDTLMIHVEEAIRDAVVVAEFPTTIEAAAALHAAGIKVLMGAPNLVRGGSHSGNIATIDLAAAGLLDVLSSDYVPASLLLAALRLPASSCCLDLAAAIRTVTKTPAEAVGLTDRGEIAVGKRADLVRVYNQAAVPVARAVWRAGERVA
jgi:alpha-D-ribose 1-methylphosphonate 5-triphosphate diphosphatase